MKGADARMHMALDAAAMAAALMLGLAGCGTDSEPHPAGPDTAAPDGAATSDVAPGDVGPGDVAPGDVASPGLDAAPGPDAGQPGLDGGPAPDVTPGGEVTYHGGVRAMLDRHCNSCHTPGGIGPFALDDVASATSLAEVALAAIDDGRMPPFPAAEGCHDIVDALRVPAEDRALVADWIAAGKPEGDPAAYVPPQLPPDPRDALGASDQVLDAGFYDPPASTFDDLRCFVLDVEFAENTYVRMLDLVPGNTDIAHHGIVYAISPNNAAKIDALDAAEPGPGYECFGGPGAQGESNILTWVPGFRPTDWGDDLGIQLEAGTKLVLQMHYNLAETQASDPGTTVHVWQHATPPPSLIEVVPIADLGIALEPGDPESVHVEDTPNYSGSPLEVVGVLPHMHQLATAIRVERLSPDGSLDCVVDIPVWDFYWQYFYRFPEDDPVWIAPEDTVRLTCVYDNSAANQPVVDGVKLEPKWVTWGDSSFDEMCLNYLFVKVPNFGGGGGGEGQVCQGFDGCYDTCRAGGQGLTWCTLQCGVQANTGETQIGADSCLGCALGGLDACLASACPDAMPAAVDCTTDCATGPGNLVACLTSECSGEYATLDACAEPLADEGQCDAVVGLCGATFGLGD